MKTKPAFWIPLFLFISLTLPGKLMAQYNEIIQTGRPGQAIGAFAVGKDVLQFQQGIEVGSLNTPIGTFDHTSTNHVIRYGILHLVELSALIDYQRIDPSVSTLFPSQGVTALHLGFRVHLSDQRRWIPSTGYQLRFELPEVSEDYGAPNLAPNMVFMAAWVLPLNMSITTNWILRYDGYTPTPIYQYVVNYAFPVKNQLSGFVEVYGQKQGSLDVHKFDAGLAYLLNPNVQFDLSAGYGLNGKVEDYFVNAGISWRILTTK